MASSRSLVAMVEMRVTRVARGTGVRVSQVGQGERRVFLLAPALVAFQMGVPVHSGVVVGEGQLALTPLAVAVAVAITVVAVVVLLIALQEVHRALVVVVVAPATRCRRRAMSRSVPMRVACPR